MGSIALFQKSDGILLFGKKLLFSSKCILIYKVFIVELLKSIKLHNLLLPTQCEFHVSFYDCGLNCTVHGSDV